MPGKSSTWLMWFEQINNREKIMKSKSYRPKQAAEYLGIGVATFWRWAKERDDFPKMIRLSARCTVIDGEQLVAWRDAQFNNLAIPAPTPQPSKTPKKPN